MISNTGGLCAIIESRYLGKELTGYSKGSIQVNPAYSLYIADKTIIINVPNYPEEHLKNFISNGNKVISRLQYNYPGVLYKPYLPRICMGIMWNGVFLDSLSDQHPEEIEYDFYDGVLYVPRAKSYEYTPGSFLEYLAYQTGLNTYDTEYTDLDIIKTRKGYIPQ